MCHAGETPFNFLGYTFETLYRFGGKSYLGLRPSDKSAKKYRETVSQLTASNQTGKKAETVVDAVNRVIRGYWNYYSLGTSHRLRWQLTEYTRSKTREWVLRKHAKPRKRTGAKRSGAKELKERVAATQKWLLDAMKLPRKRSAIGNVACLTQ